METRVSGVIEFKSELNSGIPSGVVRLSVPHYT